jgi:hypothetical protein
VEALEALRLLDAGIAPLLPAPLIGPVEPGGPPAGPVARPVLEGDSGPAAGAAAWDVALGQTRLADVLGRSRVPAEPADPAEVAAGLDQLERYLATAWARAGIAPQHREDCTQTVYETLLGGLGRDGFEHLAAEVGREGVRDALAWDTPDGPDFLRAIDMVKKRTLRLRTFQPLDDYAFELTAAGGDGASAGDWRSTLDDAIDRTLSTREAALIRETLLGKTPAEIAAAWGMAPKTVSNEKSRAIAKLREALVAALDD